MKSVLASIVGVVAILLVTVAAADRNNDRKFIPTDAPQPTAPMVFTGTLVDAGCRDRSQGNLVSPPIPFSQVAPSEPPEEQAFENAQRAKTGFAGHGVEPQPPGITAFGITIDKQTLDQQQADALPHQTPDLYTRQPDSSCAITGDTGAFALLTDKGQLLNLDSGGNTWAWQAMQSSDAGRATLNGTGFGFKPRVVVKGETSADTLVVESLSL
jgi:hypothetical protein